MFRRVVVGADQEVTQEDFDRLGVWPQEGDDAIVRDFLIKGRGFTGFVATANGQTAVSIAAGRIYDAGAQYSADAAQNFSIASYVPIVAGQKVIVRLIVQGQEVDGFVEARNNEREVQTSGGGSTVQQVPDTKARARVRNAIVAAVVSPASAAPVAPATPIGAVAIADITVGTGGIVSIERRSENEAPDLYEVARDFAEQQEQIGLILQAIGGLRNDMAGLAAQLRNSVSLETIAAVVTDVAGIKDRLQIPDTGSPYGADNFLDDSESDIANVDYYARVEEGVRFPFANINKFNIALQNPNDPNFAHAAQGLVCPKYTPVDGILVNKESTTAPLGGTTYQTMQLTQLTMSRAVVRYGDWFTVCTNSGFWQSGRYDPSQKIFAVDNTTYQVDSIEGWWAGHQSVRLRRYWEDAVREPYDAYAPVTNTIQGVIKAQTFLQSQARWVPAVKLGLTSWAAGSSITATLIECFPNGSPNPKRALASTTVAAANFKTFPEFTRFPFTKPVFLQKGAYYAVLIATTGEVSAAQAVGSEFLSGTLFDSTDGVFFQGDLTKDLCFGVEYCRFDVTRLPVQLVGLNLDGGIHNMKIVSSMIEPENAQADWQLQVGGSWRTIEPTANDGITLFGQGTTPYYDFRVMLSGNEWSMPVIDMAGSQVTLFRSASTFKHISTPYLMASGVTVSAVTVKLIVENWDAARHALTAYLLHGANYATVKSHNASVVKTVVNRPDAREISWTFSGISPAISGFKIRLDGATNNSRITYHVENRTHSAS